VQLAAAFSAGSSLPVTPDVRKLASGRARRSEARFRPRPTFGSSLPATPHVQKLVEQINRQQAGAGKSGSKLQALQSFAPYAMRNARNLYVAHPDPWRGLGRGYTGTVYNGRLVNPQ